MSIKSKQLEEVSEKLEKVEKAKKGLEENFKKTETEITKEKNQWESKASDLETDLNVRFLRKK